MEEPKEKNIIKTNYKNIVLWSKLEESMEEMKSKNKLSGNLEEKIITKFDKIFKEEINNDDYKNNKIKNTLNGSVTSFKNYGNNWEFCCKNVKMELGNQKIEIPKLKIVPFEYYDIESQKKENK